MDDGLCRQRAQWFDLIDRGRSPHGRATLPQRADGLPFVSGLGGYVCGKRRYHESRCGEWFLPARKGAHV